MSLDALLPLLLAAIALIGLAIGGMAIGVIVRGRCLHGGTCGSRLAAGSGPGSGRAPPSCGHCPHRSPGRTA